MEKNSASQRTAKICLRVLQNTERAQTHHPLNSVIEKHHPFLVFMCRIQKTGRKQLVRRTLVMLVGNCSHEEQYHKGLSALFKIIGRFPLPSKLEGLLDEIWNKAPELSLLGPITG